MDASARLRSAISAVIAAVGIAGTGGLAQVPPATPSATDMTPSVEAEIKASFIYTLAKYVQWPPQMFASAGAPVVLSVLGDDSLRQALEHTAAGKTIGGRSILVTSISRPSSLGLCQVLVIGVSESGTLREVLKGIGSRSVLTVGESDGFAEMGGVMNLAYADGMVRFKVNLEAADRLGLRISSKILALGEILGTTRTARRP